MNPVPPPLVKDTPKSRRTRRRILDEAMRLIAENGYAATVNAMVAEAAGLTRGAMLYHFPTREALLEAVILGDGGPIYQEIVGLLVDAGAKQIPDRDGVTPLEHARQRGFDAIAARIAAGPM